MALPSLKLCFYKLLKCRIVRMVLPHRWNEFIYLKYLIKI
ncbi:hypothetical protein LEP1GSC059_4141 [Leptospira noguchii serovar Panama str. CZ214]|uniref:Uncharacterized protein n=1 Tax=Leptospira noguchii serovar Panama str. CZ214 TaxID=1001595 RepID=T0GMT3_9LEPT|nr:hypothetical protein LEP1GSC059_4141 [Leptospira noguchii serovar Panama str. CZ214]